MESKVSVQEEISKDIFLRKESNFEKNNNSKKKKFDPLYKKRVNLGGISKQRRRNEPIGSIGEIKLYILEEALTKEIIWLKTIEPSKEVKEKIISKGYRILATYHADDKGEIKLPKGIVEREIKIELF